MQICFALFGGCKIWNSMSRIRIRNPQSALRNPLSSANTQLFWPPNTINLNECLSFIAGALFLATLKHTQVIFQPPPPIILGFLALGPKHTFSHPFGISILCWPQTFCYDFASQQISLRLELLSAPAGGQHMLLMCPPRVGSELQRSSSFSFSFLVLPRILVLVLVVVLLPHLLLLGVAKVLLILWQSSWADWLLLYSAILCCFSLGLVSKFNSIKRKQFAKMSPVACTWLSFWGCPCICPCLFVTCHLFRC